MIELSLFGVGFRGVTLCVSDGFHFHVVNLNLLTITISLSVPSPLHSGHTTVDRGAFHTFLRSISHKYTQSTYNLLENNCNNFSDEAARYLLRGVGIPSKIIGLPSEFLSTPLGQMVAPMIQSMQNNMMNAFAGHGVPLDLPASPHNHSAPASLASPLPPPPSASSWLLSLSIGDCSKPMLSVSRGNTKKMIGKVHLPR